MATTCGSMWITGMGAITPIGKGVPEFTRGLRAGRSGVRPLRWSHERVKSSVAAECVDFESAEVLGDADAARLPRMVGMGLAAAREAMGQAGLTTRSVVVPSEELTLEASRRVGLILGTGGGGIDFTLAQMGREREGKQASLWTITNATHGNLAGELSIRLGLRGPSLCVSTGCASSSDAVGLALMLLRAGSVGDSSAMPDAWVVVGADAHVVWGTMYTMELLRVMSSRDFRENPAGAASASRPFDKSRDGFVLGEGAWAVVVEREEAAKRREAKLVAKLMGYGVTCDAFHRVRPDPDMAESARAMRLAVSDAGLQMEDVEVVHYHGTSTQLNDALETKAVKMAFGAHAATLRGHSVKSMIGHPQGACGLASLVSTVAGLRGADGGAPFVHPTINLKERDPECDLDYTANEAKASTAKTALINCLAFGAKNSALVIGVA